MKIKRIISLILACFMVVSILSACSVVGNALPSNVKDDGRFIYSVVRSSANNKSNIETAVKDIRSAIKNAFGCNVTVGKDGVIEDTDENYEILIGDTNREESAIAKERLINNRENYAGDFIIAVINDKICIQAIADNMFEVACQWFINTFCASADSWEYLNTEYQFIYEAPIKNVIEGNSINYVNGNNLGTYSVVLPRRCSYMVGMGAEKFTEFYREFGFDVPNYEDNVNREVEKEILFGDCDRQASKSVKVEGDNYIIKVIGNKIVIKGGNDLATYRGWLAFMTEVEKAKAGNAINWSDGYTVNGKYDAAEKDIYTLTFNDEFDGSVVNLNKWGEYANFTTTYNAASQLGGTQHRTGLLKKSTYQGSFRTPVFQSDGTIKLVAQRIGNDFFAGHISTFYTMIMRYGVFEIRAKVAPAPVCHSWWFNGSYSDSSDFQKRFGVEQFRYAMTEIDVCETYGSDKNYGATVHRWWGNNPNSNGQNTVEGHLSIGFWPHFNRTGERSLYYNLYDRYGELFSDNYNTWVLYWDGECMKFGFNGKIYSYYYYSEDTAAPIHCLMNYLNLSLNFGSATYGATYDKNNHGDYYETEIDYVRIYQNEALSSQMIYAWPQNVSNGTRKIVFPNNPVGGAY